MRTNESDTMRVSKRFKAFMKNFKSKIDVKSTTEASNILLDDVISNRGLIIEKRRRKLRWH